MEYIVGIIIIIFIAFIYGKTKNTKGLVWQLVYNETFNLKPYSKVDMKLINDVKQAWWKVLISELIVFKWFLMNDIFHIFKNNNFHSQASDQFYLQLDKVMASWFTSEIKKIGSEWIKERIHEFYWDKIGQIFSLEQIAQFNQQDIFNSIQFDQLIYEDIASLLTKWEIEWALEYNVIVVSIISDYIKQSIYAQRMMIKHLYLNPQLISK